MFAEGFKKKKINIMVLIPHKSLNMVRNSQNVTVNIGTYCKWLEKNPYNPLF